MPSPLKYFCVLICLMMQAQVLSAQGKKLTAGSDTSFWYRDMLKNVAKLNLPNLKQSATGHQWRMWFDGQVTSYVLIIHPAESQLILYTQEYEDPLTGQPSNRIFVKAYALSRLQAKGIDSLKEAYGIDQIPTDEQIKGWGDIMGLDGVTYLMEKTDDTTYSFKHYWTPSAIKTDEAKKMTGFIAATEQLIGYQHFDTDFMKSIPFLSYFTGGPLLGMKALPRKEARRLRKARKAYLKSHPEISK
ncbi:hypothetical protein [Mucilaginibacter sp. CSA2-8R]|uniref:hypothetical protein n=1 Tax=Mucilaginibacter sp. CSA2-8R TaxID=3141542 RepID=UPI00315D75F3